MFTILLIVIALVHLDLEYRVWIAKKDDVFAKYHGGKIPALAAAKWAYLAKALWLTTLIFTQYFGVDFRSAVVFTFAGYAILLQFVLPFRLYNLANLLLAVACLIDWWIHRA